MEWNLKGASWDLTELDEGGLPNIEMVGNHNGSSRFGLVNRSGGEFCVDLKLGQVGNSGIEPSVPKWKVAAAGGGGGGGGGGRGISKTTLSAASGSSKRARAIHNGIQTASCLVDGCNSDLSSCREYHRRHKVCELHSKTPVVTIGGHNQRFCQQCSRFHSLEEFDEGKRSCRKRLDGHNRRRRKPQPVPLTPCATLFPNYQGRQFLSSDSNVYPSSAVVNPAGWEWDDRMAQVNLVHNKQQQQQLFLGSSDTTRIKQEIITPYHENPCVEAASACHTLLRSTTARPFSSVEESPPCALSLLSSPPQTHAPISLSQPLGLTLHDQSLPEAADTTLLGGNGGTHLSMYSLVGSDASQGNHTTPSLPFHWG